MNQIRILVDFSLSNWKVEGGQGQGGGGGNYCLEERALFTAYPTATILVAVVIH